MIRVLGSVTILLSDVKDVFLKGKIVYNEIK